MDPITQFLLPFVPLASITVTLVALARQRFPKIDGKYVYGAAAIASLLVLVWMQARTTGDVHKIDWLKIVIDAPVVFVLSVGGTSFVQKLQERGANLTPPDGASGITDAAMALIKLSELLKPKAESSTALTSAADAMSAAAAALETNVKPVKVSVALDGSRVPSGDDGPAVTADSEVKAAPLAPIP